jgi:hypothetical protein
VSDWRIDDLAQRAGVAVDTIRYYQREGLLRSGAREGRTRRYGPEHLEQLERIRALQSRRFSLAAIRALLDQGDPGALEGLLAGDTDATYDHEELLATTGVSAELVHDLHDSGLLRDPAEHGRSAYDSADVNVLRSFADLRKLAVPDAALVELARIYAAGLDAIQEQVVAVFTDQGAHEWDPDAVERFHSEVLHEMGRFARDIRVIADYTQQRNLQRVVLQKIEQRAGEAEAPER